jgi:hypothetical protein
MVTNVRPCGVTARRGLAGLGTDSPSSWEGVGTDLLTGPLLAVSDMSHGTVHRSSRSDGRREWVAQGEPAAGRGRYRRLDPSRSLMSPSDYR